MSLLLDHGALVIIKQPYPPTLLISRLLGTQAHANVSLAQEKNDLLTRLMLEAAEHKATSKLFLNSMRSVDQSVPEV